MQDDESVCWGGESSLVADLVPASACWKPLLAQKQKIKIYMGILQGRKN